MTGLWQFDGWFGGALVYESNEFGKLIYVCVKEIARKRWTETDQHTHRESEMSKTLLEFHQKKKSFWIDACWFKSVWSRWEQNN